MSHPTNLVFDLTMRRFPIQWFAHNPVPMGASPRGKAWHARRGGWVPFLNTLWIRGRGRLRHDQAIQSWFMSALGRDVPQLSTVPSADDPFLVRRSLLQVKDIDIEGLLRRADWEATFPNVAALPHTCFVSRALVVECVD